MKRILVILPKSIAGKLIMESFALGLEANNCRVFTLEIDSIEKTKEEEIKLFKPEMVLGYDYSYLMDENCKKIIENLNCKNLVFYFGDEPKSNFATGGKESLYKELKKILATVFVWDEAFVNDFERCFYLPLAASPLKYATEFSGYNHNISFVGRPLTKKRQKILCDLIKTFKNKLSIFCFEKHFQKSVEEIQSQNLLDENDLEIYKKSWKGFVKTEQELAKIYNSSKINLNITEQGEESLNYRVFEVLASGGFLITDEKKDLERYFVTSKHLEIYKDSQDLIDKIDFYIKNLNIAQKISQLGRFKCVQNHNFSARAKAFLNVFLSFKNFNN